MNALAQHQAQLLKTGQIASAHLLAHLLSSAAVVRVTGEIAVLHHGQPGLSVANKPHPEGQPKGVTRTDQAGVALRQQQVPQGVPAQLETVFKSLDQALALALIERGRLKKGLQLIQGLAEIGEALLPADIGRHGSGAMGAV